MKKFNFFLLCLLINFGEGGHAAPCSCSSEQKIQASYAQARLNEKVILCDQSLAVKFDSLKAKGWKLLDDGKLKAMRKGKFVVDCIVEAFSPDASLFPIAGGSIQIQLKQNGQPLSFSFATRVFNLPSQKASLSTTAFIDAEKGDIVELDLKGTRRFGIKSLKQSEQAPAGSSATLNIYTRRPSSSFSGCSFNSYTISESGKPLTIALTNHSGSAFQVSHNSKALIAQQNGKFFITYLVSAFSPDAPLFPSGGGVVNIWLEKNGRGVGLSKKSLSMPIPSSVMQVETQALVNVKKGDKIKLKIGGTPQFGCISFNGAHSATVSILNTVPFE